MSDPTPATGPRIILIAAVARNGGIGLGGRLLVHLPDDLQHFKRVTLGSPVVMGRKTWDSLGRPLPGRRNIVVTRNRGWHAVGAETAASLDAALALVTDAEKAFVIGGAELYAAALPLADELLLTEIDAEFPADTWFPDWDRRDFTEASRTTGHGAGNIDYNFVSYVRNAPH